MTTKKVMGLKSMTYEKRLRPGFVDHYDKKVKGTVNFFLQFPNGSI